MDVQLVDATKFEPMQMWKARKIAHEVEYLIKPICERVEVVGSVRRGSSVSKDIDFILIPRFCVSVLQSGMFVDDVMGERENVTVQELLKIEDLNWLSVGNKKLEFLYKSEPIKIEVWMVHDVEQWGLAKLVRTGPAEFSKRMATFMLHKHLHMTEHILHMHEKSEYGRGGGCEKHLECPMIANTEREVDVFRELGLDYLRPEARNVKMLIKLEKKALGLGKDAAWH